MFNPAGAGIREWLGLVTVPGPMVILGQLGQFRCRGANGEPDIAMAMSGRWAMAVPVGRLMLMWRWCGDDGDHAWVMPRN